MRRALLILALVLGLASPAQAATTYYYASTTGAGSGPCSLGAPCTLAYTQTVVRAAIAGGLTQPVVVYLRGGTYALAVALAFTSADSGNASYPVTWQSYPGEQAIISGGQTLTGWTLYNGSIYRAAAGWNFRQLYVNGTHAQVARGPDNPIGWTRTATGYALPDSSMASWGNISHIKLVNNGGWQITRGKVSTITGTALTMTQPYWTYLLESGFAYGGLHDQAPLYVENAYELMASGYWYLDTTAGYVYYWPPSGSVAGLTMVAPAVANPVTITGASYLSFKNITFDGSNWTGPDDNIGYVPVQSGYTWRTTPAGFGPYPWTGSWGTLMDAAIAVYGGDHVTLDGNTITHMGSRALLLYGGSTNATITNNVFLDNAGGDLQIGEANNCATAQESAVTVQGNSFTGTQFDYNDNGSVFAVCMANSTISNKEMGPSGWAGLSVGWGWGNIAFTYNNTVTNNWIHESCSFPPAGYGDCSSVYTNGPQLASRNDGPLERINYVDLAPSVNTHFCYDLSTMPAAFWTHVQTTGAEILATTQDGTTRIPLQLSAFDAVHSTGKLYAGTTGGTATGIRVYYNDYWPQSQPSAGSTYGANSVWTYGLDPNTITATCAAQTWSTGAEALVPWTSGLTLTGNFLNNVGPMGYYPGCGTIDRGTAWMTWTNNVCMNSPRFITYGEPQEAVSCTDNYVQTTWQPPSYNSGGDAVILAPNTTISVPANYPGNAPVTIQQPFGTPQQAIICASGSGCNSPCAHLAWPSWQCQSGANRKAAWTP